MKIMQINEEILEKYNDLKLGLIIVNGIDNTKQIKEIDELIKRYSQKVKINFKDVELSNFPTFKNWRDMYKSFGEKKNRVSVEALVRRILNGNEIPKINPLVDLYNYISIKYILPCGGEDIDKMNDIFELTISDGTDEFIQLGSTEKETIKQGEYIYKSGNIVLCRYVNYRESDITKLTEETKNVILCIEALDKKEYDNLNSAILELSELVEKYLGGKTSIYFLDKQNSKIEL